MPVELSSRKRIKNKIKESEEDSSSSRNEKSEKQKSNRNGELMRPLKEPTGKTETSIFTLFTFIALIFILSLSVGLILVELNVKQKGLTELLDTYYRGGEDSSIKKAQMSDANFNIGNKDKKLKPVLHKSDEFSKLSGSNSDEKTKPHIKTEKSSINVEEPLTKKVKAENDIPIKDDFTSSDKVKPGSSLKPEKILKEEIDLDKEPKIISNEKLKELEKQIITDNEQTNSTSKSIPSHSKKDSKRDSQLPSQTAKPKQSQAKLMDLYTEVEKLIEEILAQDPENDMVQELAPHIEGVVKDINSNKLSGIEESLLHIKEILLDLKERLKDAGDLQAKRLGDEDTAKNSASKLKPSTVKLDPNNVDYSHMDPVVEIIPDPVYIAPRESQPSHKSVKPDIIKNSAPNINSKEVENQPIISNTPDNFDKSDFPQNESAVIDENLGSITKEIIPPIKEAMEHSKKVVIKEEKNKIEKVQIAKEEILEDSKNKIKKLSSDNTEKNKFKNVDEGTRKIGNEEKQNLEDVSPEYPDKVLDANTKSEKLIMQQNEKLLTPNKNTVKPLTKKVDEPLSLDEQMKRNNEDSIQINKEKLNQFSKNVELDNEEKLKESDKNTVPIKEKKLNIPNTDDRPTPISEQKIIQPDIITKPVIDPKLKLHDQDEKSINEENLVISNKNIQPINDEKLHKPDTGNNDKSLNEQFIKPDSKANQLKEEKLSIDIVDSKEAVDTDKKVKHPDLPTRKEEFIEESSNKANLENDLLHADSLIIKNPTESLKEYNRLLLLNPKSFKALVGKAKSLHQLAEKEHSNTLLEKSIITYFEAVNLVEENPDLVQKELLREAIEACIDRLNFRGWRQKVAPLLIRVEKFFPNDLKMQNLLGRAYLMTASNAEATKIFKNVLQSWPDDGFALVHYGFILKIVENNLTESIKYLRRGIDTEEEGTIDGRFYLSLGDAYQRLGDDENAYKVYDTAVAKGLFLNRYQRSLHNIDRLKGQPVWTLEESTYEPFFRNLASNWEKILAEGLSLLDLDPAQGFKSESETLRKTGDWGQYELFTRGLKNEAHCKNAPFTCSLIENFPAAAKNKRGQTKFSLMQPGTTVFNHTGPTNCRLRAHLGLITPPGAALKVVGNLLTWEAGKIFIFDDSFEHEVWHKGDTLRLILIVDVWHPEITEEEKLFLSPI